MALAGHDHEPVHKAAERNAAAQSQPVTYRAMRWDDVDALAELFDRIWPQTIADDSEQTQYGKLLARCFVLHYVEHTTNADVAVLTDGTIAGVACARVAGLPVCLPQSVEAMKQVTAQLKEHSLTAMRLNALNAMFDVELELERESAVNETTQGELELFMVNPDAQGKGIGGSLWRRLHAYFAANGVSGFYLHTDSSCDVSFYDHNGLTCVAQRCVDDVIDSLGGVIAGIDLSDDGKQIFEDMFIYRGEVAQK